MFNENEKQNIAAVDAARKALESFRRASKEDFEQKNILDSYLLVALVSTEAKKEGGDQRLKFMLNVQANEYGLEEMVCEMVTKSPSLAGPFLNGVLKAAVTSSEVTAALAESRGLI